MQSQVLGNARTKAACEILFHPFVLYPGETSFCSHEIKEYRNVCMRKGVEFRLPLTSLGPGFHSC